MTQLFKSRFTSGATAEEVCLNKGETVKYKSSNGDIFDAIIDSELMLHTKCSSNGYECIFPDDNARMFLRAEEIVWWEGKA